MGTILSCLCASGSSRSGGMPMLTNKWKRVVPPGCRRPAYTLDKDTFDGIMRPACSRGAQVPNLPITRRCHLHIKLAQTKIMKILGRLSLGQVFMLNACDYIEYQRSSTWRPAPHTKRPELRSLARGSYERYVEDTISSQFQTRKN
ncbi:hypothetical protein Peur_063227 [Populus x canadensis]